LKLKSATRLPRIGTNVAHGGPRVGAALGGRVKPLSAEEVVLDEVVVGVEAQDLLVDMAALWRRG
jgi:hypothetical protein